MKKGKENMKKIFLFIVIFLFSLSACNKDHNIKDDQKFTSFKQSKHNDIPDHFKDKTIQFEMKIEPASFDKRTKHIPLVIRNNGDSILYGTPYELEVFQEDKWRKIPFQDNIAFTMIGIILDKGKTDNSEIGLDTDNLKYNVHPGYYRIVKEFSIGNGTGEKIKLSSIFQLK
ncbi:immunoglobulin-like domain-containing protein [Gottfriedia solisilvae]|nr:immunoglobulin-like domain-containing protein [Gottfriedia solisilvae]